MNNNLVGVLWTIFILIGGAWIGAVVGTTILFGPILAAAMVAGPLGWLVSLPLLLAQMTLATVGTFIVPLWALIGGAIFAESQARKAAAGNGLAGMNLLSEAHPVYQKTQELAAQLDLPKIKWVGWFEGDEINAFAMGLKQENALIAFSEGAIKKLTKEELDAVIGHELAHVANNDMSRMTYTYGVRNALTWFLVFRGLKKIARWLFTPLSELELLRFSRRREFAADKIGAQLTSKQAMINALKTIQQDHQKPSNNLYDIQHFAFRNYLSSIWSTHPSISTRIVALTR